jgi:hypothetical protein
MALVAKHIPNEVAGGAVVVDDQDLDHARTLERSGEGRNFDGRGSAVEATSLLTRSSMQGRFAKPRRACSLRDRRVPPRA